MLDDITVVLIDPPNRVASLLRSDAREKTTHSPPIGLAYIAAVLRENGAKVRIIDAKSLGMTHKKLSKEIEKEKPDIAGINVFTFQQRNAMHTAERIKAVSPSTKVVVGGPHIHPQHEEVANNSFVDFCVRGEGEITMLKLINAISTGGDLRKVKGITFKEGKEIIVTPDRPFIKDLDSLPFPARDLLPNHLYKGLALFGQNIYTLITASRGCPFRCHFCSVSHFWSIHRSRSVENVVDEMEHIYNDYGIRYLRFTDELLPVNRKWMMEFCKTIVKRGLSKEIVWSCDGHVKVMTREMINAMSRANCGYIFYGIEFGNQRILDLSGKGTTLTQIRKAVEMTKEAGIAIEGNFMMGYPTETKETIEETIKLARNLNLNACFFCIVTPFPGTELYRYCKENNLLKTESWEEYDYFAPGQSVIKLKNIDDRELAELYRKAKIESYFTFAQNTGKTDLFSQMFKDACMHVSPRSMPSFVNAFFQLYDNGKNTESANAGTRTKLKRSIGFLRNIWEKTLRVRTVMKRVIARALQL
jgi:anaerobic magnesium-protoporphyrin IX monomethyl ester cyclase